MEIALILIAAAAVGQQIPDVPVEVQIIDENGVYFLRTASDAKPLYTYDRDTAGNSTCYDRCAVAWPALLAPRDAKPVGNWTVTTRTGGALQWAYQGKPVYTHARDANEKASGDGQGGVWHLLPTVQIR